MNDMAAARAAMKARRAARKDPRMNRGNAEWQALSKKEPKLSERVKVRLALKPEDVLGQRVENGVGYGR